MVVALRLLFLRNGKVRVAWKMLFLPAAAAAVALVETVPEVCAMQPRKPQQLDVRSSVAGELVPTLRLQPPRDLVAEVICSDILGPFQPTSGSKNIEKHHLPSENLRMYAVGKHALATTCKRKYPRACE
jgi:hypothetical protein